MEKYIPQISVSLDYFKDKNLIEKDINDHLNLVVFKI